MTAVEELEKWEADPAGVWHKCGDRDRIMPEFDLRKCKIDPTNNIWFCWKCQLYAPPEIQFTMKLI